MASLTPASSAAIARLRAFAPPPTQYYNLPLTRRAAVLILLFADRRGELRVVLTVRSATLNNYAGQSALPGGKSDSLNETPWATARREAWEEIGLPERDVELPKGWQVERLTELPCNLAVTELGVRPVVAWLKARRNDTRESEASGATGNSSNSGGITEGRDGVEDDGPDPVRDLLPTLEEKEVAAVFTAPFHNFLRRHDEDPRAAKAAPGHWYQGAWINWHEEAWRMHQFFVPHGRVFRSKTERPRSNKGGEEDNPAVAAAEARSGGGQLSPATREALRDEGMLPPQKDYTVPAASNKSARLNPLDEPRYKVFGMTARILVDAARVAYGEEPDFEHNSQFGDEEMIARLMRMGRLSPVRKKGETLTRDVMRAAAKM